MAMDWLSEARNCYEASTTYVDANYRRKWEYDLRAFQNEHAPGSKYLSDDYKWRSKLFRPKTRSVIRKGEAAAFMTIGNIDDIEIGAEDPDNLYAVAAAQGMRAMLDYRLNKTIPWPLLVAGAYQDASSVGVVCSYNYWIYKQKEKDGQALILEDRPCIKLLPVENLRIDAAADWLMPVESSPYFIEIIPMYVCDVKAMMSEDDPKTGHPKWKTYDDKVIAASLPDMIDSTRQVRQGRSMQDPHLEKRSFSEHDVVWVMKFFMKKGADDYCFYTLGTHALLTEPKLVEDVYFHGKRPYTMGCTVLETHKPMSDGPTYMSRDLQREMNDNVNSRMDNVKLVLNKRYLVARGRQVDIQSLLRNAAGGVTMLTDPKMDVVPLEWNDVTASAYMEQDKLNQDFDDLIGNFSPNTRFANVGMSETLGGSKLAMQGASAMTEYQIQTLVKTWVEPTLRQLMLLEQYYETDQKILMLAGRSVARAFPKFGGYGMTDTMLMQELVLTVNVGAGATDPQTRLQKFLAATQAANQIITQAPPGANVREMINEVYRNAGYRNGSRFFPQEAGDPRLPLLMNQIQQLSAALQDKRYEIDTKAKVDLQKAALDRQSSIEEIRVNAARIDLDARLRDKETEIKNKEADIKALELVSKDNESVLKIKEHDLKVSELAEKDKQAKAKTATELIKLDLEQQKVAHESEQLAMQRETQALAQGNEQRIGQVAAGVSQVVQEVGSQVTEIRSELQEVKKTAEQVQGLQQAMMQMAQGIAMLSGCMDQMQKKPKPKGWKKKIGADGKKSIVIVLDDNSEQEMTEH